MPVMTRLAKDGALNFGLQELLAAPENEFLRLVYEFSP
jgi:hypothetical protein